MTSGIKSLALRWAALFMLSGAVFLLPGCAGGDPYCKQLSQQQAATIESLQAEIVRLNNEINRTVSAHGAPKEEPGGVEDRTVALES